MPKLLLIDNYDSFTYNVVQALRALNAEVCVVLHDEKPVEALRAMNPEGLVLSPGPGNPQDAGICQAALSAFDQHIPVLGICLGHQVIGQHYGGDVIRAERIYHGHTSPIEHQGSGLFKGLPSPFEATRYHSLVVSEATLPDTLEVTARDPSGAIMGIKHRTLPVEGVQFHPESFLTCEGPNLLSNFVQRVRQHP